MNRQRTIFWKRAFFWGLFCTSNGLSKSRVVMRYFAVFVPVTESCNPKKSLWKGNWNGFLEMCVLQRRAKSFVKLWERGENKFLTSWELETRRVGMNEGKRPKSFSSVLLFRFSLFDEGISSFSFLFLMATFQFLFRYSFFASSRLHLHSTSKTRVSSSQKTSVVKAPGFFQVFMALKVNVTVSLLIL